MIKHHYNHFLLYLFDVYMQFFLIDYKQCMPINKKNILNKNNLFFLSVEIRPENEYDKLLRLSNEYFEGISNDIRPCGGFSLRYECACDFYQIPCHRSVQNVSLI